MAVFYGTAKELQFKPDNGRAYLDYLVENEGKRLVMNISLEKARRSLDQNAFYWAYLEIIANETGNNSEDLHRLFKGLFLPKRPVILNGKTYMMSGSTTELNKPQFSEYMEKICAETGVPIPDPKLLQDSGKQVEYPEETYKPTF